MLMSSGWCRWRCREEEKYWLWRIEVKASGQKGKEGEVMFEQSDSRSMQLYAI